MNHPLTLHPSIPLSLLFLCLTTLHLYCPQKTLAQDALIKMPGSALAPNLKQQGWQIHHLKPATHYRLTQTQEETLIHATSKSSASLLIKEHTVDLTETPILTWSWKTDALIQSKHPNPEKTKSGDDFVARLHVVAKGAFPWQIHVLNYIWSAQNPVGAHWDNPYTKKEKMIVVETGGANLHLWQNYQRNIQADFKQYFDLDVSKISAYAIMVDTDNTAGEANTYFKNIRFKRRKP